jgi:Domain of unknown function (DUF4349)
MSQRDLVAELRGSRVAAPADVRARVRQIAAGAPARPRNRFTWKQALVVALPAAAAIAAAVVVTRPSDERSATPTVAEATADRAAVRAAKSVPFAGAGGATIAPLPTPNRAQRYSAYLALRVATPDGVSDAVKRALRITSSLGGHPTSVHAGSEARSASADLTLRVPRTHVQEAIARLSTLGTITSESVDVQDLQPGLDATDRRIAKLQAQLAELRRAEQTDAIRARIVALTTQVQRLQRAKAATMRVARFATVELHLQTPPKAAPAARGDGPLHGLGVAFRWLGIGAVYALALGAPLVALVGLCWFAARLVRRRRENALLGA